MLEAERSEVGHLCSTSPPSSQVLHIDTYLALFDVCFVIVISHEFPIIGGWHDTTFPTWVFYWKSYWFYFWKIGPWSGSEVFHGRSEVLGLNLEKRETEEVCEGCTLSLPHAFAHLPVACSSSNAVTLLVRCQFLCMLLEAPAMKF